MAQTHSSVSLARGVEELLHLFCGVCRAGEELAPLFLSIWPLRLAICTGVYLEKAHAPAKIQEVCIERSPVPRGEKLLGRECTTLQQQAKGRRSHAFVVDKEL